MADISTSFSINHLAQRAVQAFAVPVSVESYPPERRSSNPPWIVRLMGAVMESAIRDRDIEWLESDDDQWMFSRKFISDLFCRSDPRMIEQLRSAMVPSRNSHHRTTT